MQLKLREVKSPEFRLYARDSAKDLIIGGDNTVFTPGYGAPFVTELNSGRRKGTLRDFVNFVKLTGASINQDICSGTVIEPNDVPHEIRQAQMLYTAMKYSDKCFMGSAMGGKGCQGQYPNGLHPVRQRSAVGGKTSIYQHPGIPVTLEI